MRPAPAQSARQQSAAARKLTPNPARFARLDVVTTVREGAYNPTRWKITTFLEIRLSRNILAGTLCSVILLAAVATSASAAAPEPTAPAGAAGESVAALVDHWRAAGSAHGGGDLDGAEGRRVAAALSTETPADTPADTPATEQAPDGVAVKAFPPCHGTFNDVSAVVVVQQSPSHGIPWGVKLTPANSSLGVVNFSAQIYADRNQANVYQPHIEPWNYLFHGPLPRTFQKVGGGTYTMHGGSTVSFLWYWRSVAQPGRGGYAYLNCVYSG